MSTLLLDAECKKNSDWLTRLGERKRFTPRIVGSNYQPLGTRWSPRPINDELACRKRNQIVSIRGNVSSSVLFFGGYSPMRNVRCNDIHELSEGGHEARLKRRRCEWSPRCGLHAHASRDGKVLIIIGGDDGNIRSDTWVSVDGGACFRERSDEAPWGGRMQYSTCLFDNDTILLCGGISSDSEYLSDLWISRDQGTTWTRQTERCPWGSRKGMSVIRLEGGSILMAGGSSESRAFDDVWKSTDLGITWSCECRRAPWKPREGLSMIQDPLSSEIVMFGGSDHTGHPLSDAWASVDGGVSWTPRPQLPSDASPQVVPIVSDHGTLEIYTMGSHDSPTRSFSSQSDLKFIRQDCVFLLMLGKRLEKTIPKEIWIGKVLPMAVDLRSLWTRKNAEWKKL
jgi:hypothetical protein